MDPITFALILGAAFWVTDTASSGLLRAEVGGGLLGAFGGAGRKWWERRKTTHERRAKRRSKSRAGRAVNAVFDEFGDVGRSFFGGWPEGRTRAHERRRQRWQAKPPWWKRYFGPSEPEQDDPEQPEGPEGSESELESSEPGMPERNPWDEPEPIRTAGSTPETFRLDVTTPNGLDSGAFASRLPKGKATSAAIRWAEGIMRPLSAGQDGVLYRTTGGADKHVVTLNGQQDPDGGQPDGTDKGGTETVGDLNSAQAVIAAWEEIKNRIEQIKADLKQLSGDASGVADSAGVFKVGTEDDGVKALDNAVAWLGGAEERIGVVVASIHDDFDASIEASEGKKAEVHSAFQGG